ncbi:MAG: peptidylprolyl isomerase [Cardiobacteriaceae bacterium]|nr:peptidylprolyl isomerase [Cardiobacteriaceae bacterium]
MIRFITNFGNIDIELDFDNAPRTAKNFQQYAEEGFFNGTIFHRVIPDFVIQGGGMQSGLVEKANKRAPIENEADNGLKNNRGTLSMARTQDPHSASSQFFINLKDNDFLNFRSKTLQGWGYAVFGKVVAGMEIVDKIATVRTGRLHGHSDVPLEDIVIEKTEIL